MPSGVIFFTPGTQRIFKLFPFMIRIFDNFCHRARKNSKKNWNNSGKKTDKKGKMFPCPGFGPVWTFSACRARRVRNSFTARHLCKYVLVFLKYVCTLTCLINEHARLPVFQIFAPLHDHFQPCSFIEFIIIFPPARLIGMFLPCSFYQSIVGDDILLYLTELPKFLFFGK